MTAWPTPGHVRPFDHHRGALREREHEHEVEEQLEWRDLLAVAPNRADAGRAVGMLSHRKGSLARSTPTRFQSRTV